jgi:hypothetical protein
MGNALFRGKIFALDIYRSIDMNTSQLNTAERGIQNALQKIKQNKYVEIFFYEANSLMKSEK